MNFSAPIRVTWEITARTDPGFAPGPGDVPCDGPDATILARKLVDARVFHVRLVGEAPLGHANIRAVVESLRGAAIHVGICDRYEPLEFHADWLKDVGALPILALHERDAVLDFLERDPARIPANTLLLSPERTVVDLLDRVVARLGGSSPVKKIIIPNPGLSGQNSPSVERYVYGRSFLESLQARMEQSAKTLEHLELVVHDFFLARALMVRSVEFDGCQAGNAMAHVAWDGSVFPCSTLNIPLGNLAKAGETLRTLWAGPQRKSVVQAIADVAAPCVSCSEIQRCHGGCRGMANAQSGGFKTRDPGCLFI